MAWTMARVAALLNPYYDKETPQGVRNIEAEDWAEALGDYPQWAIQNAVRWWKSADNPQRRKRPLEGDIVDRVRREMTPVRNARIRCDWAERGIDPTAKDGEPERKPVDAERAAEIMAQAGFRPKTFGGSA